jgi:hypothetical protein
MTPPRASILRRSILPSAASLAIHALLLLAILGVTVHHLAPPEPALPLLEIDAEPVTRPPRPPPTPLVPPATPAGASGAASAPTEPALEQARDAAAARFTDASLAPPPAWAAPADTPPVVTREPEPPAAAFAGLQARAATRIVYVVDASGAMVHTLSFVLDELARSISRLQPTQSFQVILLGERPGHPPLRVLAHDADRADLVRATPANRQAARLWLNGVVAGGRSNPLDGLRAALEIEPDLVFLLARGIQRTGTDQPDQADRTLAELDRLNPRDPRTALRPATIKTIQFIDEDPTGLLPRIAQVHGDGEGSTRLVRPESLGDEPPPQPTETVPAIAEALDRAASALAPVERDLSTAAVLAGVATEDERRRVRDAAEIALRALADIPPAAVRTPDARPNLLRSRAALLACAAEPPGPRRADLAQRAIDDARPLTVIDPADDGARQIALALARVLLGSPGPAHDALLALIRNREDFALPPAVIAPAHLALLRAADAVAPDSREARLARASLHATLAADSRDADLWPDPPWRALAAAALAGSLRAAGEPDPLAPLLALLRDGAVPIDQRRALVAPRLERLAPDADRLPPDALDALARSAAWTARPERAVDLFLRLADAAEDPQARADALRNAAMILRERGAPGDDARSRAILLRLAGEHPDSEDARHALTLALDRDDARPDEYERALALDPDHPLAPRWTIALARLTRGEDAVARLEALNTPEGDALAMEILDERLGERDDRDLLGRAAAIALRRPAVITDERRLRIALPLLASDPARVLALLDPIRSPPPEGERLRLRALLALERDADAFALARDLAARLEPAPGDEPSPIYWEALTAWLELGAARGGPTARAAARAHIARVRLSHPDLGGEPWSARLGRIAE